MKKLIIIITMFLFGCSTEFKPVENPDKITTIEILQNTQTGEYSIVDGKVYIIENDKVKFKAYSAGNCYWAMFVGFLFGIVIGLFVATIFSD